MCATELGHCGPAVRCACASQEAVHAPPSHLLEQLRRLTPTCSSGYQPSQSSGPVTGGSRAPAARAALADGAPDTARDLLRRALHRLLPAQLRRAGHVADRRHGTVVSVFDPELIKQVFTGDPDVWRAGGGQRSVPRGARRSGECSCSTARSTARSAHAAPPVPRRGRPQPWRSHRITHRRRGRAVAGGHALRCAPPHSGDHARGDPPGCDRRARRAAAAAAAALLPRVAGANLFAFWAEGALPGLARSALGSRLPWIAARREVSRLLDEEIAAHRAEPQGREDVLAMLIGAADDRDAPLSDDDSRTR